MNERKKNIDEMTMAEKVLAAMQDAVAKVIEQHRRENAPLVIMRDGKIVWIDPFDLTTVREPPFQIRHPEASIKVNAK